MNWLVLEFLTACEYKNAFESNSNTSWIAKQTYLLRLPSA